MKEEKKEHEAGKHSEKVGGFLDGRMDLAHEAFELVSRCAECRQAVRDQAGLDAVLAAARLGSGRSECLDRMRLVMMTPDEVRQDPHLAQCARCRLDWLHGYAEAWEASSGTVAKARPEERPSWFQKIADALAGLLRPQVLVPVGAAVAVVAVAGYLWTRPPPAPEPVFAYEAWSGDPAILNRLMPEPAMVGLGLSGGGEVPPEDVSSFRVGFAAGLVRDLYAQNRGSDALRAYRLVVESGRLKLDPVVAAEFVRMSLDPCALPGVVYPEICRIGIMAYGLARTAISLGRLSVEVPVSVRETVLRLHAKIQAGPPEASGVRAAPPGTPEMSVGILLDLFRF